jgi:hypothetical protein
MLTAEATAPTYETLRPLRSSTSSTFPVYRDLVDKLVGASLHPDSTVAHALGTCAGYAYSDERTVAMIMARMGLANNRCRKVEQRVDAMFICSTSYLLQSECGRVVIVCYRGTEPANFINWLTDADVNPEKVSFRLGNGSGSHLVHAGFYRNVRATRYEVIRALERAMNGESIFEDGGKVDRSLEALYITGHSLGAAMAAIMGLMISTESAYEVLAKKLRAVYAYGQPMIGTPDLAAACEAHPFLGKKVIRFVYGNDIVPALPPTASGPFAHFGPERRFRRGADGIWEEPNEKTHQVPNLLHLAGAPIAFLAQQVQAFRNLSFPYSLDDHGPQHYISALTPPNVRTEFGD